MPQLDLNAQLMAQLGGKPKQEPAAPAPEKSKQPKKPKAKKQAAFDPQRAERERMERQMARLNEQRRAKGEARKDPVKRALLHLERADHYGSTYEFGDTVACMMQGDECVLRPDDEAFLRRELRMRERAVRIIRAALPTVQAWIAAQLAAQTTTPEERDNATRLANLRSGIAAGNTFSWKDRACGSCGSIRDVSGQPLRCPKCVNRKGPREPLTHQVPDEIDFWMGRGGRWGSYEWAFGSSR